MRAAFCRPIGRFLSFATVVAKPKTCRGTALRGLSFATSCSNPGPANLTA